MKRLPTTGKIILVVVLFFAGVALGWYGRVVMQGRSSGVQASKEARILEWIVERNPDATIRDFLGFPAELFRLSAEAEIDYRLILAIADKESQMRPRAVGANGEIGLMQLLPSTAVVIAKRLEDQSYESPIRSRSGQYASLGSLADPAVNVRYGIEYLKWQIERFGATPTAVRAFNRHPDKATEYRPADRYAEDVALKYFTLAQRLR